MSRSRAPASRSDAYRQQLAVEAAKLIADGTVESARAARRKVADRHGLGDHPHMPDDSEIEAALRMHQRLFRADAQPRALAQLRAAAIGAMEALHAFCPRLVGSVLDGTADEHSAVHLYVYCDETEAVLRFLDERVIPMRTGSQRLFFGPTKSLDFPTVRFANDEVEYRLTVLSLDMQRQTLTAAKDEPPPRTASLAELRRLHLSKT